MSSAIILVILLTTAMSAFISGIFGMAGGMILMGVLVAIVPIATAMITHGAIMMTANGWRAYLLREAIDWPIFRRYLAGAAGGLALLLVIVWRPNKADVYLILGLVPILIWLPRRWLDLDIRRRGQAELAGFLVQGVNTLAGVAGPLLDVFFVRTDMTRQQVVATKSATQVVSHIIKIVFWSAPLILAAGESANQAIWPPIWVLLLAAGISMIATAGGKQILDRMGDVNFRGWVKGLVTLIGGVYLARAAGWL